MTEPTMDEIYAASNRAEQILTEAGKIADTKIKDYAPDFPEGIFDLVDKDEMHLVVAEQVAAGHPVTAQAVAEYMIGEAF